MAKKEKLITFLAEEEHFQDENGFMELIRRIQHFGLDKFGVVHVKVPESVTAAQRKKLVPLLENLKLKVSLYLVAVSHSLSVLNNFHNCKQFDVKIHNFYLYLSGIPKTKSWYSCHQLC